MSMDPARHLGAITRVVTQREHQGRPARVVIATRSYRGALDDVWDALTNPERIPRWFLPVTGDLRLGGRYQLQGNAGGTITRCEPPQHLGLTWEMGGEVSWVEVRLAEGPAGLTRLELQHVAPVDDARWDQYGPGAVGVGWELGLIGLDLYLGSGVAVDPGAFMGWMGSEAGRSFVGQASAGWGEASIAAGTDATAARAAAARTTAFYTGAGDGSHPEGPADG